VEILLTGAEGFLGSTLKEKLSILHKVYSLSRNSSCHPCDLSVDIPIFKNIYFDLVIHAAGIAHFTSNNQIESNVYYDINVVGTENLLRGLERSGVPLMFVFISTVAVYGDTNGNLITESSKLKAVDPYGKSKLDAEKLVLDWCKDFNVLCTILRLPLVVSKNPPGNLGTMIHGIKKGFYFNIAGGRAKKSMVLATDVAKYILKSAEVGGVYNLTDGYHPSFYELSIHIAKLLKKRTPLNLPYWLAKTLAVFGDFFGSKAPINSERLRKIHSNLTFDDSKARDAFGWDPTPVLKGNFITVK
jgi:nucleoside-diphosphate-sugar epimerase